jgi:hypothetical protein
MRWSDVDEVISWAAETPDNRVPEDAMMIGEDAFSGLQERLCGLWKLHEDEVEGLRRDLKEAKGFAERVSACVDEGGDLTLFGVDYVPLERVEVEWMRLPVDADGIPWHEGDLAEWEDGARAEVIAVGRDTLYYVDDDEDSVEWTQASDKRHAKQDTWEQIIEDAFGAGRPRGELDVAALVARCKALAEAAGR